MEIIREVWSKNLNYELDMIDFTLGTYNFVAIDTEFPGFLRNTPRDGSEECRYDDLRFNVESLKLIQLGLTLFDAQGRIGGTWQINFSDFDFAADVYVDSSIQLLKYSGIDLEKNKREGVVAGEFAVRFAQILDKHIGELRWVAFHGLYDFAYLLKMLSGGNLPDCLGGFAEIMSRCFAETYDVKYIARYCDGLMNGELGLEKLSTILKVRRLGQSHQAGSDCLLTARVFLKMKEVYGVVEENFNGFLYGIEREMERRKMMMMVNFGFPVGSIICRIPTPPPPYGVILPGFQLPCLPPAPFFVRH